MADMGEGVEGCFSAQREEDSEGGERCRLGSLSTGDGMAHLCMLSRVKGHSLLIIKIPLIYE